MRQLRVSDHDLLHLFEMCLDAEERCEERCHTLREQGAHESAAYAAQMRDKYAYLKARIFRAMKDDSARSTLPDIVDQLSRIRERSPDAPNKAA
jgi:hypothetical protein